MAFNLEAANIQPRDRGCQVNRDLLLQIDQKT